MVVLAGVELSTGLLAAAAADVSGRGGALRRGLRRLRRGPCTIGGLRRHVAHATRLVHCNVHCTRGDRAAAPLKNQLRGVRTLVLAQAPAGGGLTQQTPPPGLGFWGIPGLYFGHPRAPKIHHNPTPAGSIELLLIADLSPRCLSYTHVLCTCM